MYVFMYVWASPDHVFVCVRGSEAWTEGGTEGRMIGRLSRYSNRRGRAWAASCLPSLSLPPSLPPSLPGGRSSPSPRPHLPSLLCGCAARDAAARCPARCAGRPRVRTGCAAARPRPDAPRLRGSTRRGEHGGTCDDEGIPPVNVTCWAPLAILCVLSGYFSNGNEIKQHTFLLEIHRLSSKLYVRALDNLLHRPEESVRHAQSHLRNHQESPT